MPRVGEVRAVRRVVQKEFRKTAACDPLDAQLGFVLRTNGAGKTSLAALVMQHFGAAFEASKMPANWTSTEGVNEKIAFHARDTILVIDDYAYTDDVAHNQRLKRAAERILRGQGNNAGRKRLKSNGEYGASYYPRGLIISTGEDVAGGQSVRP